MRNRSLAIVALALAAPGFGAAQDATQPSPAPVPVVPAPAPAPPPPPAPAPATAPPPSQPEPRYSGYVAVKGGYFSPTENFQGSSLSGNGVFEAAIGWGHVLGLELASGYMKTTATGIKIETVPLMLSLRLALPIAFIAPFAAAGAGACWNKATAGGTSRSAWAAEWHAGLGIDFYLGPLLLGAEARYMGFSKDFSNLGSVDLNRYQVLARAGLRF